jgi:hypothetical protein
VGTKVEWWTSGLSPDQAVQAFSTSALVAVIIQVLMEERLAYGEIGTEDIIKALEGGRTA